MFITQKLQYRINLSFIITLLIIVISCILYSNGSLDDVLALLEKDNHLFYWMLLVGFFAEIIAGSMGMGYGVICTSILLMLNIAPPVVSASIHSAETFTTAAGSISHYKLKNVKKNLVIKLAIPAVFGAIIGAITLTYVGEYYAKINPSRFKSSYGHKNTFIKTQTYTLKR
jgi:hypothetical protein